MKQNRIAILVVAVVVGLALLVIGSLVSTRVSQNQGLQYQRSQDSLGTGETGEVDDISEAGQQLETVLDEIDSVLSSPDSNFSDDELEGLK